MVCFVYINTASALIEELRAEYDATEDWDRNISPSGKSYMLESGETRDCYTIDLENALLRPDNKPVLVVGDIYDVKHGDEESFVIYLTPKFSHIYFRLLGEKEQVENILHQPRGNEFVAIVMPSRVHRVQFKIVGDAYSIDDSESLYDLEINSTINKSYIVEGRCLALRPLEQHERTRVAD